MWVGRGKERGLESWAALPMGRAWLLGRALNIGGGGLGVGGPPRAGSTARKKEASREGGGADIRAEARGQQQADTRAEKKRKNQKLTKGAPA